MTSTLQGSDGPLSRHYDVALLDLDGVVYIGSDAVAGVPAALTTARGEGMQLAFVTNNAARPPAAVADHLRELGVPAQDDEVITSAQAAARYLAERLPAHAAVLVLGTTGLTEALTEQGLTPVSRDSDDVAAVVQGYSPTLDWAMLAEGSVAIRRGVPWIATNVDPTVPSPRGPLPGNGSMVAALRHATGVEPVVTGKPDPTMHRETLIRTGAQHPLVVGDRLDTDIEGANAVGCDSLLVLSGVTSATELICATPEHRPTFVSWDAAALLTAQPPVKVETDRATCGQWTAQLTGSADRSTPHLQLAGQPHQQGSSGADGAASDGVSSDGAARDDAAPDDSAPDDSAKDDALDALRALCVVAWRAMDAGRGPEPRVDARGHDAEQVLAQLELR